MEEERFEELVSEALDGLPTEIGLLMDNVAVFIEPGSPSSGLLQGRSPSSGQGRRAPMSVTPPSTAGPSTTSAWSSAIRARA